MKIQDFEAELQLIDKDISIIHPSNGVAGLSGVYYRGQSICGCPEHEIFDEVNHGYTVETPMGNFRHKTRGEVKAMVEAIVKRIQNDKDYSDAFFGEGEYKN